MKKKKTTKIPDESSKNKICKKEKDPKRIAVGRKLAEYNKKAKEALARQMKRDEVKADTQRGEDGDGWTVRYANNICFGTTHTFFPLPRDS